MDLRKSVEEMQKEIEQENKIDKVREITQRLSCSVFGVAFKIRVDIDNIYGGRVFIQIKYCAPCSKTGINETWSGRKWYLSEFMTEDEVVKTSYAAFEAAVKHEVMEGFKVDGIVLFNPHVDYTALLEVSHLETKRIDNR